MSTSGTLAPTPGEILTLEVPLSAKRRADAVKDGNSRLVHAKMAIAVPQSFDPQKSWPVLVISNTEAYSNIDSMQQFKQAAMDEGWVIMAADAVEAEKDQEGGPRWPTIAAAFDYITPQWPAMKDWPIATGGMSGGAKNSAFLAADLAREHHRIIGILMMGCNQDMATVAFHKSAPPGFLSAAVFISSGKSDKIATPAQHEDVKNSLRATGFQRVRLESFDSAHQIYQPHIGEAALVHCPIAKKFDEPEQNFGLGQVLQKTVAVRQRQRLEHRSLICPTAFRKLSGFGLGPAGCKPAGRTTLKGPGSPSIDPVVNHPPASRLFYQNDALGGGRFALERCLKNNAFVISLRHADHFMDVSRADEIS